ncbi:LysR substrate-binding domain-containing protein [Variovorax sp. R-27]|uniref:LysR substrate-binding domain-containing protein n=1 Tax=Variovorax sp. R-27 TaxID=3404058 RepID=UPI003CF1ACEB
MAFVGTRSPSTDWRFLHDGREIAIPASDRLQANNANALLAAALVEAASAGLGVALSPLVLAADDVERGSLSAPAGFDPAGSHHGLIWLGSTRRVAASAVQSPDSTPRVLTVAATTSRCSSPLSRCLHWCR